MTETSRSASNLIAEIASGDGWQTVGVDEARLAPKGSRLRCVECHGQVLPIGSYGARPGFSFQHRRTHDGCSRLRTRFNGTPSRHPLALT